MKLVLNASLLFYQGFFERFLRLIYKDNIPGFETKLSFWILHQGCLLEYEIRVAKTIAWFRERGFYRSLTDKQIIRITGSLLIRPGQIDKMRYMFKTRAEYVNLTVLEWNKIENVLCCGNRFMPTVEDIEVLVAGSEKALKHKEFEGARLGSCLVLRHNPENAVALKILKELERKTILSA